MMSVCSPLCQHPGCWTALKNENQSIPPLFLEFKKISKSSKNVLKKSKAIKNGCLTKYTILNLLDSELLSSNKSSIADFNKSLLNKNQSAWNEKNKLLSQSFKKLSAVSKDAEIRKDFNYHFKELHLFADQNFYELHDKVYIWIPSARKKKNEREKTRSDLTTTIIDGKALPKKCIFSSHIKKNKVTARMMLGNIKSCALQLPVAAAKDSAINFRTSSLRTNKKSLEKATENECLLPNVVEYKKSVTAPQVNLPLETDLLPTSNSNNSYDGCVISEPRETSLLQSQSVVDSRTNLLEDTSRLTSKIKSATNIDIIGSEIILTTGIEKKPDDLDADKDVIGSSLQSISRTVYNESGKHLESNLDGAHLNLKPSYSLSSYKKSPTMDMTSISNVMVVEKGSAASIQGLNGSSKFSAYTKNSLSFTDIPSNTNQLSKFSVCASNIFDTTQSTSAPIYSYTEQNDPIEINLTNWSLVKEKHIEETPQKSSFCESQEKFSSASEITLSKDVQGVSNRNVIKNPVEVRSNNDNSELLEASLKTDLASILNSYDENILSDLSSLNIDVQNFSDFTGGLNLEWNSEHELLLAAQEVAEILSN